MENREIGLRTLDIHTGLYKYQDPLIDLNLSNTILIGKAASLASHLRGVQLIEHFDALIILASKLGITSIELSSVLEILDNIRYIRIIGNKRRPERIEVLIDKFDTAYERLGESWDLQYPKESEIKTLEIVNELSKTYKTKEQIIEEYDLDKDYLQTLLNIGQQGGFLGQFSQAETGQEMLFSPIYMEENPVKVLDFLSKHNAQSVQQSLKLLDAKPGYPIFELKKVEDNLLLEILSKNIIQTPAIVASGGKVNFMFSPFTQVEDKQMLKDARNIVAAIRYGESFSRYSRLQDPMLFLERLLQRKYIGKTPHSDIEAQYGVLRDSGLGRIEEVVPGRYRFYLADTQYAKDVVNLAKKILFTESDFDPDMTRGIISEAWSERRNLSSYQFNEYIPNLSNLKNVNKVLDEKRELTKSRGKVKEMNTILNKLFINGGEPDVF